MRYELDALDVHKSSDGLRLVEQVFVWKLEQPEVLPPSRFVLAAVPIEEIREQPAGVLRVALAGRCLGNAG
jgi:hypothetical protein